MVIKRRATSDSQRSGPSEQALALSVAVRTRMRANRSTNTGPELAVRKALRGLGLRFGTHSRIQTDIGVIRPDLTFYGSRIAVFVDGCFWHRCRLHRSIPKANRNWWMNKLDRVVERDRKQERTLRRNGWSVFRVWEHERPDVAAKRIARRVGFTHPRT